MEKVTRDNIVTHLCSIQLKMIGKTIEDVKDDPEWYHNNTFTVEQLRDFDVYAFPLIKKVFKCNSNKAKQILAEFDLYWGLRIVPTTDEHKDIINKLKDEQDGSKLV